MVRFLGPLTPSDPATSGQLTPSSPDFPPISPISLKTAAGPRRSKRTPRFLCCLDADLQLRVQQVTQGPALQHKLGRERKVQLPEANTTALGLSGPASRATGIGGRNSH